MALLSFSDVVVEFRRWRRSFRALDGVSGAIERGESLGIVGESGSGKTTLARVLVGLTPIKSGVVEFEGRSLDAWLSNDPLGFRRRVQIIFQDPYGSLNPRMTVRQMLSEVLRVHRLVERAAVEDRICELLEAVGLDPASADRYPHAFSGGQRQRLGIARALAVQPSVLIADEPVSSLDVSVQAQVLNLLAELRKRAGLTLMVVAHDLAAIRYVCDRLLVMQNGRVVEEGPTERILASPAHPYTQTLLDAAERVSLRG